MGILPDISLQLILFRIAALFILPVVLGGIVAGVAVLLGDKGPKYDGRLTIAPQSHGDLVGGTCLVLFGIGWPKPMAIDARELRNGPVGVLVVVLAGFIGLMVLAVLLDALILPVLTALPHSAALTTAAFLRTASSLAIWFALFNLLPVPPLAGGMILEAFGLRPSRPLRWILVVLLVAALATGMVHRVLGPAHAVLTALLLGG